MKTIRAVIKYIAFILLTFGVYSLWVFSFFTGEQGQRRLREFIFYNWARGFVWLANAKLKIVGEPPAPPFLLVSNHVSYFDIAALRSTAKCVFVAKADIETWFIAGKMVGSMGQIFINRENRRDIPRAGARIIDALERGEGVAIFVEGTTSNGKQILEFKSSFLEFAAAKDLPVHYASITYQTPPGEPPASEAVCWWREESGFGDHLFEFFKLPAFEGTITFGKEPIHSTNRKELAAKLHQAVEEQFVPVN
jgi:1-acyl-sn-glycerol-3-phosphate acyltransferase